MANPANYGHGTQTCTIGTEHFIQDVNAVGTYVLTVRLNNLVAGDVLEIRVYKMTLTGGTAEVAYPWIIQGGTINADNKVFISPAIGNTLTDATALRFSIKQTLPAAGGRNVDWVVEQYV